MTETRKSPFVWGAATSAFQIEGGAAKDGRADSVWDVFCRSEGRIFEGGNAETACRSYERFEEDVRLLKGLHVQAYRFSVSWPRVLPQGVGEINEKGVQYYRALVQALRENGIEPYVTLYHWDLPQALSLRGGLLNRDFAEWFAEYAAVVAEALGEGPAQKPDFRRAVLPAASRRRKRRGSVRRGLRRQGRLRPAGRPPLPGRGSPAGRASACARTSRSAR